MIAPLEHVLSLLQGVKSYSRGYTALCPSHADKNRSLTIWEDEADGHVGIHCFAGCERKYICQAIGITETDLYLQTQRSYRNVSHKGIDLLDLVEHKLIHPHALAALGVTDDFSYTFKQTDPHKKPYTVQHAIRIPYYTQDGQEYSRFRIRTALIAKNGTVWDSGDDPVIPYGLHKLEDARKAGYVVIVEGESDCWTLWQHGLPGLGIAGATLANCLQIDYFTGIEQVYIVQEPDEAGSRFPDSVYKRLQSLGYKGRVYVLDFKNETGEKDPNDLHKKNPQVFKSRFETALLHAKPLGKHRTKPKTYRLADLQHEQLPETRWAIPDILPEGLTLLCGKPKLGKSWLALALQTAIASGSVALGNIPVERGQVLYISLEDNKKRLQKRSNIVLRNMQASPDFEYATEWPRLNEGGVEALEEWIQEHPRARIICIDTWAKFKPRSRGRTTQQYDEDYDALSPLQELANKKGIAIVVIHHFRKMEGDDPLDMIAGSTAMSGAVDGFMLLYRKRGESDARLYVVGRDIEEEQEYLLSFNQECASWVIKGNAETEAVAGTPQQQEILDALLPYPDGLTVKVLAERLGKNINTTRNLLVKLRDDNKVILLNNVYSVVTHSKDSKDSKHSNHSKVAENEESAYYGSSPLTTQVTTLLSNHSNPVNPLAEPVQSPKNSEVTTLTMVTTHASLPVWLRPGTRDWDKLVDRVGYQEAMERRQAALREIEAVC